MPWEEPNPGLDRIRFQLRADGVAAFEMSDPLRSGIHTRGYLPHVKREGASYFVTFRLTDSLPQEVLLRLLAEKSEHLRRLEIRAGSTEAQTQLTPESADEIERDYQRKVERYLDRGAGKCWLRRPEFAAMVSQALCHFQGEQYLLDDWVVMPNHVHLIIWPLPNFTLSQILKGRKQFTAVQANQMLHRVGHAFWQRESFDHWIRNDAEKARIRRYIRWNPVSAGLCESPEQWPWSSAGYER